MGLWEKFKNIMTIPEEDEIEEEEMQITLPEEEEAPKKAEPKLLKSKTVSYNKPQTAHGMQVVLSKPSVFEDARGIADHLNAGKTVVLNLEDTTPAVTRRIIDFLSGAAYANGGMVRNVAKNTFIIVANGIDVMGELSLEELGEGELYF